MYSVSSNFKNYIKMPSRTISSRLLIASNTYTDNEIIEMNLESNLVPGEEFTLGCTVCNKFEATIITDNNLMALNVAKPYIGLDINGVVEEVPLGVFNIYDLKIMRNNVKIVAYDNMIKFEKVYFSDLTYPAKIHAVATEICQKAGVSFSSSLPNYSIDKIEGKTLREAIGIIAGICGGFSRVNRAGHLEIIALTATDVFITTENFFGSVERADKNFTIKKITAIKEGNTTLTSGSGLSSEEVTFSNSYITKAQLDSILTTYTNYSYRPLKLNWQGNPALEVGDKVTITDIDNTVYTIPVMRLKLTYQGGLKSEISSVAKSDSKSEYDYKGPMSKKIERMVIEQADIKVLLADKATIEDLIATNVRIDNFIANTGQIADLAVTNAKIDNATITSTKIALATITGANIANATIDTANIKTGAITNALIGAAAIDTANIKTGAIITALIANANITTALIADGNITNAKIADGTIDVAKIKDATITAAKIADATITSAKIQDGTIVNADIANSTITGAKIANATIGNANIVDATITAAKIALATITSAQIANATIDTANIKNGAITTALIGTAAVGTTQIVDASITDAKIIALTANKITAGTIDASNIEVINLKAASITVGTINGVQISSGTITSTNLSAALNTTINDAYTNASAALTTANGKNKIYRQATAPTAGIVAGDLWFDTSNGNRVSRWNGTGWDLNQFGNAAVANLDAGSISTGYLAAARIQAGTITGTMIAVSTITASNIVGSTITGDKIAAGAISAINIASRTITTDRIVAGAITTAEIASKTITANNIASNTITTNEIAANTITAANIAAGTITTAQLASNVGQGLDISSNASITIKADKNYVASRGQNLVTNGTGLIGNNTNFSSFSYDGSDGYYSKGSFKTNAFVAVYNSDELIPVDVTKRYKLSAWAKTNPHVPGAHAYIGVVCYDCDGNQIAPNFTMFLPNTTTTLAQDLKNGDTVVYLANAANWNNAVGSAVYRRRLIFWDYKNAGGYQYQPNTYSRHGSNDDIWTDGAINYTNNTITLKAPWSGGTVVAGTSVSQADSGGTYKYITNCLNTDIPADWTNYTGAISGVDLSGTNAGGKFHPATASVKLLFLLNRDVAGSTTWLSNISFGADEVYADGVISAINVTPESIGISASKITLSGTVTLNSWSHASDITKIDGADIYTGSITAYQIKAGTITAASGVIANAAITGAMIANATITAANISNTTITAAQIANGTITNAQIANGTIGTAQIANLAVTTALIADGAITNAKITNLNADKITGGTIDANKVSVVNINASNIVGGTLSLGGTVNGAMYGYKYDGTQFFQLDKNGMQLMQGAFRVGKNLDPNFAYGNFEGMYYDNNQLTITTQNLVPRLYFTTNNAETNYKMTLQPDMLYMRMYDASLINKNVELQILGTSTGDWEFTSSVYNNLRFKMPLVMHNNGFANTVTSQSNAALRLSNGNGYVDIGAQNAQYLHLATDRPQFWFNKNVACQGRFYQGTNYNQAVWGSEDLALSAGGYNQDINGQNLNNIMKTGFYRGSNMANAPDANWYYVIVQNHDNNYCSQIAFNFFTARVFTRERTWLSNAWVWTPWVRLTIDNDFYWTREFSGTFNGTSSQEGTLQLANGFQMKFGWFSVNGNSTATYNFPSAFPNGGIAGMCGTATDYTSWGNVHYAGMTRTSITANNPGGACKVWYFALGY